MLRLTLYFCVALLAFPVVGVVRSSSVKRQKYALIIGVKGYPNFPEGSRLKFADEDAKSFKRFIQSPEGNSFPEENIKILLNQEATRERIYEELNWLSKMAKGDDLVYFFFSGHGSPDKRGQIYLMPYNASEDSPQGNGILANQLLRDIGSLVNVKYLITFIDACHAAAAANADSTTKGEDPVSNINGVLSDTWEKAFQQQDKDSESLNIAFFSASANQVSREDDALKQGVFTHFLIKGLSGEANRDKDQIVTAEEIRKYLINNVGDYTIKKFKKRQSPMTSASFNDEFPLAVVSRPGGSAGADPLDLIDYSNREAGRKGPGTKQEAVNDAGKTAAANASPPALTSQPSTGGQLGDVVERTITISAADLLTDTGIKIKAGQEIRFRVDASKINLGAFGYSNPDGVSKADLGKPAADCKTGAVIARISQKFICVNAGGNFKAESSGTLHLGLNESKLSDNYGSINVKVSVY